MGSLWDRRRGATPAVGLVLMAAVAVIVGGAVAVSLFGIADTISEPAPTADIGIDTYRVGDGIARNDAVVLVHEGGDRLDRESLEIRIGNDVVFNDTRDSESNSQTNEVAGLIVEVDDDEFNDLNKPCRSSPPDTCGGPPGDADGSDASVVHQWENTVRAGQRLVIQERNSPQAYDTIQAGETIELIYRGDGIDAVLARARIEA
jgi:hypothetical protein